METYFKKSYALVALIAVVSSCDVFQKDASPTTSQNISMLVPPNSSAVIDLGQVIPDFRSVNVVETSNLQKLDANYLGYQAGAVNRDQFSFSANSNSGAKTIVNVSVAPQSQTNNSRCDANGAFTYAKIRKNSSLVVNVLNNAEFCGYAPFPEQVSAVKCEAADVWIKTYSWVAKGIFIAIVTYTPPVDFVGVVKFKYYLGIGHKPLENLVGVEGIGDPGLYDFYSEHEATIEVIE